MVGISEHLRNSRREIGFEDLEHPLTINCCGFQSFKADNYYVKREQGRLDYQLIYIYQGCGHYKINDNWQTLNAGNIVLYKPLETQVYCYKKEEKAEVFWIHFTGNQCENIIDTYSIQNSFVGVNVAIKTIYEEIMLELQLKKPYFETIINTDFYKLLVYMQRVKLIKNNTPQQNINLENLIIELNKHYMKKWTISSMADFCYLSNDYFAHIFQKKTGLSPIKFLTNLRIEKAKELLLGQGLSINSIAKLVGYEDPLYFSRVFKKETGLSPKQYQKITL